MVEDTNDFDEDYMVQRTKAVAAEMPVIGFYLQEKCGGRPLSFDYWAKLSEIENVVAIKCASFNRYQTLDVVREVEYDSIYTFIYSPRKGTPAAVMENQIPEEVQKERFNRLVDLQNSISKKFNESAIGKTLKVLVDGKSKNNEGVYMSRTENNRIVHFECDKDYTGQFINIKITRADTFALYGEI